MSAEDRRPGPVDEPAEPIDKRPTTPQREMAGAPRQPGPVDEPADPMVAEAPDLEPEPPAQAPTRGPWTAALSWTLGLMGAVLAWQWGDTLLRLWPDKPWLALPLSVLSAVVVFTVARALFGEYRAARRIDRLPERQQRVAQALACDDLAGLHAALGPMLDGIKASRPALFAELEAAAQPQASAQDYLRLLEHLVLQPLDEEVRAIIHREASVAAGAVAVVPHPALDALVVLWRAALLIRRIGECYGLAPTALSSLRLLKHALGSALLAAGVELAGQLVIGEVGSRAAGATGAKRVAAGGLTYVRLRGLGKLTQRLCRPIPPPERVSR